MQKNEDQIFLQSKKFYSKAINFLKFISHVTSNLTSNSPGGKYTHTHICMCVCVEKGLIKNTRLCHYSYYV